MIASLGFLIKFFNLAALQLADINTKVIASIDKILFISDTVKLFICNFVLLYDDKSVCNLPIIQVLAALPSSKYCTSNIYFPVNNTRTFHP